MEFVPAGKSIGIPKFCCGASFAGNGSGGTPGAGANGGNGCGPKSSDPVDLASGNNLAFRMRDFGIASLMPVNLKCNYRSTDSRIGPFGRGGSFAYDWYAEAAGDAVQITTPEGVRYLLSLQADGAYRASEGKSGALGWEVRPTAGGRTLRLQQGDELDFDGPGRLIALRNPSSTAIRITRDSRGFPQKIADGAGRSYTFDTTSVSIGRTVFTLVTRITDSIGRSLAFTYDGQARLVSHTDAGGGVTGYDYDTDGRIAKRTDPRGYALQFSYDAAGRTTSETLQDGTSQIHYDYATAGSVVAGTRLTDANGNATSYRFNGQGYETRITDALGRVTTLTRDTARNLVQSSTDAAGRITRYTYDVKGNVTSRRDAQNNLTLFEYGPLNNKPTAVTDALGNKTTFTYDAQARLISATDATGATATQTWTANGLPDTQTDANGNITRYAYDAEGNLIAATDPLGHVSHVSYDSANRPIEVSDPLGLSSQRAYDVLDRVTAATDPAGGITRLTYDPEDRLLSVTDPRGNPIEQNAYDARGRLAQRKDAAGLALSLQYDPAGNLTQATDRKGQLTSYAYDALNRPTRREDPDGRVTSWEYDLAGNVAAIRDNKSGDILFAYDSLNRPTRIVTDQGTVDYQYDAIGRRTQRTVNGTDAVTYAYDKAGRLTQLVSRGRTTTFTWDAGGRLTSKTLPNGLVQTTPWDAANRLTGTTLTKQDGSVIEAIAYEYDAAGRRTARSATVTDVPETAIEASYDAANRLTTVTIAGQPYALTYDANGNLTKKAGTGTTNAADITTYTWDARNMLTAIQSPTVTASFKYDALGRRIEKTVNGDSVQYLYDGPQAIAEIRGSAVSATYLTTLAIDEVIARYTTQGERTLLTDALGSVILAAKEDGTVQTAYGYSPYGETQVMGAEEGNPVQYTARENDGTGLYYYRARYYDPVLKRFPSEDPIGLDGGINTYSYVNGSPLVYRDPSGLCPWCIGIAVGGVVGIIQTGNAVGWSWNNAGTIAAGGAIGAAFGAIGTWSVGSGLTAAASGMLSGGTAGFLGNIGSQIVVQPSLAANPSCIDYRQAAFQGLIGLGSGYLGGAAYGPYSVANPAVAAAAVSGVTQTILNLGVSTGLGGFGATNIVR